MRVRATQQGDIETPEGARALFAGQIYDIPDEIAQGIDWLEPVDTQAEDAPPRRRRTRRD